jgi:hypothetical protein
MKHQLREALGISCIQLFLDTTDTTKQATDNNCQSGNAKSQ